MFVFTARNFFFAVTMYQYKQYLVERPDLSLYSDYTFEWVAMEGAVIQPFLIYHIYVVTHKEKVLKKKNQSEQAIDAKTNDASSDGNTHYNPIDATSEPSHLKNYVRSSYDRAS